MKDKGRAMFSARRLVIRRRVAFIQRILTVCMLVCAAYLLWYRWDSREAARKNQKLQEIARQTEAGNGAESADATTTGRPDGIPGEDRQDDGSDAAAVKYGDSNEFGEESGFTDSSGSAEDESENAQQTVSEYAAGFGELSRINQDLKGWISIPGTALSLPLVQGSDNSYYLDHDFYGEQDRRGTIFIDCGADLQAGQPNTVIYGHHMRDGSMFGILKEYRKEPFYREHPSFFISLPDGEREYEILAVLRNDIFEGNEESFQYYDYKRIEDKESFADYCRTVREHAIYDTGVEAQAGDELVTLCTCDYGSRDQRLLVVGKRKQYSR